MKPKHQRLAFIVFALVMLGIATTLILTSFKENIVFFYAPSDIADNPPEPGQFIRVGGFVEQGSVTHGEADHVTFQITDFETVITVNYQGTLPALFREEQGVVAEGVLTDATHFKAERILAKHDENYMPPEVAKTLKKSGHWKDQYPAK